MHRKSISLLRALGKLLVTLTLVVGCMPTPTPLPATDSSPTETPEATIFVSVLPTLEATGALASVLPTPTPSKDLEVNQLTPDPNWAALTGTLLDARSGQPVSSVVVFLETTPMERRVPAVLYGPPNDQPRATTNENGQFLITEIPEGEYVLVVYSPPLDLQVATVPSSGEPLFITAQVGSVIDLGSVTAPTQ